MDEIIGTVGHERSPPIELPATEGCRHRSVAEQTHASSEKFYGTANDVMRLGNSFASLAVNSAPISRGSRTSSNNNTAARIDMALAEAGAREAAALIRSARLRDMLAAITEWERAAFQAAVAASQLRRAAA